MKLNFKNIGKIKNAEIAFNGITVISGENNTGKSTISKALFAIFNGIHDIDGHIIYARQEKIASLLQSFFSVGAFLMGFGNNLEMGFAKEIVKNQERYLQQPSMLVEELKEFHQLPSHTSILGGEKKRDYNELAEQILKALQIPADELRNLILQKSIQDEFKYQVMNMYSSEDASMHLQEEALDIEISFHRNNGNMILMGNYDHFTDDVVYIDDPFVLDRLLVASNKEIKYPVNHQEQLIGKILQGENSTNVIDDLLIKNQLDIIISKISEVCNGTITKDDFLRYYYKQPGDDKAFNFANVSTGLKTFIIVKAILLNGALNAGGVIILDEPEVHLHPKWQLLFSEIIVLLHKHLKMRIVLNTHSPYFLRAIQVYSAKYKIADKCSYYLAELEGDNAVIKDTSQNIDAIYAKLAEPFQQLENERWQDD